MVLYIKVNAALARLTSKFSDELSGVHGWLLPSAFCSYLPPVVRSSTAQLLSPQSMPYRSVPCQAGTTESSRWTVRWSLNCSADHSEELGNASRRGRGAPPAPRAHRRMTSPVRLPDRAPPPRQVGTYGIPARALDFDRPWRAGGGDDGGGGAASVRLLRDRRGPGHRRRGAAVSGGTGWEPAERLVLRRGSRTADLPDAVLLACARRRRARAIPYAADQLPHLASDPAAGRPAPAARTG